jgi:hypothetical protein
MAMLGTTYKLQRMAIIGNNNKNSRKHLEFMIFFQVATIFELAKVRYD